MTTDQAKATINAELNSALVVALIEKCAALLVENDALKAQIADSARACGGADGLKP